MGAGKRDVSESRLAVLDLVDHKVVAGYPLPIPRNIRNPAWSYPVVTPDGEYLLTIGMDNNLVRSRIKGKVVTAEQVGSSITRGGNCEFRAVVSPDGKWVSLPVSIGNEPGPVTQIYAVKDLTIPVLRVKHEGPAQSLAWDPPAERIYTQTDYHPLVVFNYQGSKLKEYKFHRENETALAYLVHPEGRRVVIIGQRGFYYVDMRP